MNKELRSKIYEFTKYLKDWDNNKTYYVEELLPEILNYNFADLDKNARKIFLEIRDETNPQEWNNIINIIIQVKENYEQILQEEKNKIAQIEILKQKKMEEINQKISKSIEEKDLETTIFLVQKYTRELMIDEIDFSSGSLTYWLQKIQIIKTILSRKIQKLVHFTNISNLESILTLGLLTRENMDKKGICSKISDNERYDKRLDCTSLSIEYPNYPMLSYKRSCNLDSIFCVLVFDAQKILLNDVKKYYVNVNAANNNAAWWLTREDLSKSMYLEKMFNECVIDKGKEYTRENLKYSFLTTHPQAEILFNGPISPSNILEVHFENSRDYDSFMNICNIDKSSLDIDFIVSDFYFKNREEIEWDER